MLQASTPTFLVVAVISPLDKLEYHVDNVESPLKIGGCRYASITALPKSVCQIQAQMEMSEAAKL